VTTAADWERARAIRHQVFVVEQRCPPEEEFDRFDRESRHFLGWAGGRAVATARWRAVVAAPPHGEAAKLERFAVLAPCRGRGWGRALVEHLAADARRAGHRTLLLHAQAHLEGYYAALGFAATGDRFVEAGLPHVRMVSSVPPPDA
jgi:predicted GNAT family N-acyltransferase